MSTDRATARDESSLSVVEFARILVATDFSEGASEALASALVMARCFQSKIYLVHVIPAQLLQYVSAESSRETLRLAKEHATKELARMKDSVDWGPVACETILREGAVWPVLHEIVEALQVDLIAMGTYGSASTKKFLLGSVAEEIFRSADCSTLTVGPQAVRAEGQKAEIKRVLYATNFKPHAERAGNLAYTLEQRHHAQLAALHVVGELDGFKSNEGHGMVRDFLLKRMRKGMPQECVHRCEPEFLIRFGEPADEILRAAAEQHSDLIILGLRATTKSAGLLPSATAYKLVCKSPCPVLAHRQ